MLPVRLFGLEALAFIAFSRSFIKIEKLLGMVVHVIPAFRRERQRDHKFKA